MSVGASSVCVDLDVVGSCSAVVAGGRELSVVGSSSNNADGDALLRKEEALIGRDRNSFEDGRITRVRSTCTSVVVDGHGEDVGASGCCCGSASCSGRCCRGGRSGGETASDFEVTHITRFEGVGA